MVNPYDTLGVPRNSPVDVCKKAYRRLAAKNHPDAGGSREVFDKICEAWTAIESGNIVVTEIKRSNLSHVTLFTFA